MWKASFYDCRDVYILVKGTIAITGAGADAAARQTCERKEQLVFQDWAPFTDYISKICSKK